MLSVIMLSVIMLSVIMLSVIMLSVIMLNAIMLIVIKLTFLAPYRDRHGIEMQRQCQKTADNTIKKDLSENNYRKIKTFHGILK